MCGKRTVRAQKVEVGGQPLRPAPEQPWGLMVELQRCFGTYRVGFPRLYTDDFKAFEWEREKPKLYDPGSGE